ncbi:hypothetical protein BKA62DRAFT_720304 [Auriculariales sp. MPI-PUGE-AT-0066]|nr:hypothetical protein BKA62DRAFT_720304 [Auriculariales sp. MPI-PUGE-AT-0066]
MSNSGSASGSASETVSGSSSLSIPATAAAGGITFTQPPQTASASFYKIGTGQTITFGFNYTSLSVTPSAITFKAWCSQNAMTYDMTTIQPPTTKITWSPFDYEAQAGNPRLAEATYVLQAFDERGPQAMASGGYFSPNQNVRFALYRPQNYVPLESWTCGPDCDAAGLRAVPHTALVMALATFLAVLMGGLGVIGRRRAVRA